MDSPPLGDSVAFERWLDENKGILLKITNLDLSKKGLTSIPDGLFLHLKNLKILLLSGNQLVALPDSIGELENLEGLFCEQNQLLLLPENIGNLKKLEGLFLSDNQLTTLPESFFFLEKSTILKSR